MSLKSLKSELSELQEERDTTPDDPEFKDPIPLKRGVPTAPEIVVSSNGIRYLDPRPLRYCCEYKMLIKPTIKCCRRCGSACDVIKLIDEEWTWYLNPDSGNVTEQGDEESIPVPVFLKIATVSKKNKFRDVIVIDRFKDMTDCPRNTYCKP